MENSILEIVDNIYPSTTLDNKVVCLYTSDKEYKNELNILKIFSKEQDTLKKRLLEFTSIVYNKVKKDIQNRDELAYILGNLFFEKSPYKTDALYLFYKLNIVIDYIDEHSIDEIILHSTNHSIIQFFQKYSSIKDIKFLNKHKVVKKFSLKDFVMKNPSLSFLYKLKYEVSKISKNIRKNIVRHNKVVVSYYPSYYFEDNQFMSKYFMDISKKLNKEYDWLFIYASDINDIKNEESILDKHNFNQYNFLDSYIDYKDLLAIYTKHKKLLKEFHSINLGELFIDNNGVDYIDIFIDDWQKSLSIGLLDTLIFETKFNNYFKEYKADEVLYLMEYQPWEQMLNKVVKNFDSSTLTKGITHSVIRPNLLNYFHSKDIHKSMYIPDVVGVNSDDVKTTMSNNGFTDENIKQIEAQRFNYLSNIKIEEERKVNNNLLITTSIDFNETKELLKTFAKIYTENRYDVIYIKAHPDLNLQAVINTLEYFPAYISLTGSMSDAFKLVDTVYTANTSSVLLESLMNNKKTVTLFSLETLPMPAIDEHHLLFIATNKNELKEIIYNKEDTTNSNETKKFLYLDNNLARWERFIND